MVFLRNLALVLKIWLTILLVGVAVIAAFSLLPGSEFMVVLIFSALFSLPALLVMTVILFIVDLIKLPIELKVLTVYLTTVLCFSISFIPVRKLFISTEGVFILLTYFIVSLLSAFFWTRRDLKTCYKNYIRVKEASTLDNKSIIN